MIKNSLLGLAILFLGFGSACEDINNITPAASTEPVPATTIQASAEKKYVIRAGEQHAVLSYETTELPNLKFKALFDSSAIYQTLDAANQGDINKLYGVSDCNSYHHSNSARFGWRWYQNQLEIWAYSYVNGERLSAFVDAVALNEYHEYEILFEDNKYVFRLNDKIVEMPRACQAQAIGYKLFPYFGGDETAPQDISILIEELKN